MGYNTYNPMREYSENNEYRFHFKDHWPFDLEKERAWVDDHNLEKNLSEEINQSKNNLLDRMLSSFVCEYIYCYGPCFDRDFKNQSYNVLVNANNDRLCDGKRCTNENFLEKWEKTQEGKKPTFLGIYSSTKIRPTCVCCVSAVGRIIKKKRTNV
jgi:hypothetical protein